jgi:hypothetical protein
LSSLVDSDFAEQISIRPGFISYEFLDCGDSEAMSISIFDRMLSADASRELAQRWTEQRLHDFDMVRFEAMRGEVMVSRADPDMLEPAHMGDGSRRFGSVRRYMLRSGDIGAMMRVVNDSFAERIKEMRGFEAYHALDCGRGAVASISMFTDQEAAETSDDMALEFVHKELATRFDLERTEVIGGEVTVSRAMTSLLVPEHARS